MMRFKEVPEYTAEEVISIRKKLGLGSYYFAFVLGVAPQTVQRWERGDTIPRKGPSRLISILEAHPELVDEIFGMKELRKNLK
jgi:DNA-binding transcriptional regulator YiaG